MTRRISPGPGRVCSGLLLVHLFDGHSTQSQPCALDNRASPLRFIDRRKPLAYYWFILLNAAMYALSVADELLRRPSHVTFD